MEDLKLKDLNLSLEESRYIIEFLARKRNVNNYKRKSNDELLHSLKESEKQEKSKNNQQQQIKSKNKERIEVIREQFKELNLSLEESIYIIEFLARKRNVNDYKRKSNDELLHSLKESEKQEKSKNNQQQQIKSKNKERIEVIREQFKELAYKL